jgi:hypothetical protein
MQVILSAAGHSCLSVGAGYEQHLQQWGKVHMVGTHMRRGPTLAGWVGTGESRVWGTHTIAQTLGQCCQYFESAYGHLVAAARVFPGHPPKNESGGPEVLGGVREKYWGFSAIFGGFHAKFNNAVLPLL